MGGSFFSIAWALFIPWWGFAGFLLSRLQTITILSVLSSATLCVANTRGERVLFAVEGRCFCKELRGPRRSLLRPSHFFSPFQGVCQAPAAESFFLSRESCLRLPFWLSSGLWVKPFCLGLEKFQSLGFRNILYLFEQPMPFFLATYSFFVLFWLSGRKWPKMVMKPS